MPINYIKLYFCLTLSGLTLWGVDELYTSYKLHVVAKEAQAFANQAERDAKAAAIRA